MSLKRLAGQTLNTVIIETLFIVAAVIAGGMMGGALGLLGGSISPRASQVASIGFGLSAVAVSLLHLRDKNGTLFQRNRETPRLWLDGNSYAWALKNGIALGVGFTSRIGYASWYLVPAAAILARNYAESSIIFATYSFTRAAASSALLPVFRRYGTAGLLAILDRHRSSLKRITVAALGLGGLALSIPAILWGVP